jgi:uncharacterized protein (TIGR00661 family)
MNILYGIQGTGNGHVCRAIDIVPLLSSKAKVDVLISGTQSDIRLPFPTRYNFGGLSFIFGKKGGVDLLETYRRSHIKSFLREVYSLPVEEYDLVISDFEPVTAWACVLKNKPCIALSHQAAILNKNVPHAKHIDPVGKAILKRYAPASVHFGFHFASYDDNIFTPVIRKEVRQAIVSEGGHYTVYLPAYSDERIISVLEQCEDVKWHVFSKHFSYELESENVSVYPLDPSKFVSSMASSAGVLCGAGFETPAEALFLGKKLMVIPMKKQYEQHCNAAALRELGVPAMKSLKSKHLPVLLDWLHHGEVIKVDYPDMTEEIIDKVLSFGKVNASPCPIYEENKIKTGEFLDLTLRKIISKLSN